MDPNEKTVFLLNQYGNRFLPSQRDKRTTGKTLQYSLGKDFSWGHSLAAGRHGTTYAC